MRGSLLRRAGRRSWSRHPLQLGLSILGVALGVAVAVSVDLANASAREAFRISTEAVTGRATHHVVAGSRGLPDELYRRIRVDLGVRDSAPVVEGWADGPDGRTLRVLGIDPLAEVAVRRSLAAEAVGGGIDLATLLASGDAVLTTAPTAAALGVGPGDGFVITLDGAARPVRLVGLLAGAEGLREEGLRDVLVADVAAAQELLGTVGRLDRIDLVVAVGDAVLESVREALPGDARLVESAARSEATLEMTRAFALNLRAMSLLAVGCGVFLIYNTMTFSVVRRRPLLGQLRVLGVTRREVFGLVVSEAFWIGLVGTLAGLAGGWLLAGSMVRLVTRSINDLYFTVSVQGVTPDIASLARAAGVGLGATLLASLAPAREATRTQPRAVLQRSDAEQRTRRAVPRLAVLGLLAAAAGATAVTLPTRSVGVAFAGLFLLLVGASLITPAATRALAAGCAPLLRRVAGLVGALAGRGVVANLSRTAVAVAALMIAVSVIIGVGVMVTSFRTSLEDWLGYTLQADLYVSPAGDRPARTLRMPDGLRARLDADPEVAGLGTIRTVDLAVEDGLLQLVALEPSSSTPTSYDLIAGDPATAWEAFGDGAALVSEPFAYRTGIGPGDLLRLPAPAGPLDLPVAGVYRSYVSDRGTVMVHRRAYESAWGDPDVTGLSIELRAGAEPDAVRALVEGAFAGVQRVSVVSSAELRRRSLEVFDRTFLITGVLRALVSLVAFVGVFAALMAMALERSRELGILRATGLTPRQLFALVTAQTGLLGLIAGVLALPLGTALAWVMIHVINRRSFGWSLDMHVPAGILMEALAIAVGAALLAGVWPASRQARRLPAAALREE